MANDVAIKVDHVSKTFRLPHEKNTSLKSVLINFHKRGYEKQKVLENISFEIKKGEFFGIVGRNGSGKSTLLKLLAGIYTPSHGNIEVTGKLTPFIELGVGFNPELTGRENVFLNGALLGFSRKEVLAMYDDIVAFAELERFMDQKLKNYSSGMQVRLAFSVAIRANTDILLIDEVLAVGDQSFQEKCFEYFKQVKNSGKTIVFVTHDMSNVERFCDRVFVIDKSKEVNGLYSIPEAVSIYNKLNHGQATSSVSTTEHSTKQVFIKSIELTNVTGHPTAYFNSGDAMKIKIDIATSQENTTTPLVVGIAFHDKDGYNLAGPNSTHHGLTTNAKHIIYHLPRIPFNMGEYYLTVALFNDKATRQLDLVDKGISFFVNTAETYHGKIILEGSWITKP